MSEFIHLHLHTEYSLLDGACRIDELLDQAVQLKMPAIAVTEHGNMFSSVIFHDHAPRARHLFSVGIFPRPPRPARGKADPRRRTLQGAGQPPYQERKSWRN